MFFNKFFYRNVLQYMIGFANQIMQLYETNALVNLKVPLIIVTLCFNGELKSVVKGFLKAKKSMNTPI